MNVSVLGCVSFTPMSPHVLQASSMALNMSDDEDILHPQRRRRDIGLQPFPHSDDEEDIDLTSDSDGEAEQVQICTNHKH